jgi:hypothetical protein
MSAHDAGACGACQGLGAATPATIDNRPGLGAIAYRAGVHGQWKRSLLAALSAAAHPELAALTTREDDDFVIALLDAWAVAADVLTFYQERIANECLLRTATERLSVLELARLIGYQLRPGVAAGTWLAFTVDDAAGAPGWADLPVGTRVQSLPGPGETPQTFETITPLDARAAWNGLRPARTEHVVPAFGDTELYLAGVTTNLRPGDALLLVGAEREADPTSDRWDVRRLTAVTPDHAAGHTRVAWDAPLGSVAPPMQPASRPRAFALRLRTALFGHNAPDPRVLPSSVLERYGLSVDDPPDWTFALASTHIDLDGVHPGVREDGWVVLAKPTYRELYRAVAAVESSRRDYTLTGKTTRVTLDGNEHLDEFSGAGLRDTVVFAESEALDIAARPLEGPMPVDAITLDRHVDGLEAGRLLIVTGKAIRVTVAEARAGQLTLVGTDGSTRVLEPGEVLRMTAPVVAKGKTLVYPLEALDGMRGRVTLAASSAARRLRWTPAGDDDEILSELGVLDAVDDADPERSTLRLAAPPLANAYDRASVTVHANVTAATHGETVAEVLGSGDAARPSQRFVLRQPPLTHVSAATPSGTTSTLSVWVNDLRWHEVPTLYGTHAADRVFVTRTGDDGRTTVQFGDGAGGARPPSGQHNVRAQYRRGIGLAGNVRAGQLSLLMSKPAGLKAVTNPVPASGAADPEQLADARENAPLTVLTLDRVVSLLDYQHFARAFGGIAKALATWTWDGRERGVFVTVAGPDGALVPAGSALHHNLVAGLRAAGDPNVALRVQSYRAATFALGVRLTIDPDHVIDRVRTEVETALRAAFSFAARSFAQVVVLSEVIAVIQSVPGVLAVDVDRLHRSDAPVGLVARLPAARPTAGQTPGPVLAAELLTLAPGPLAGLETTVAER